MNSTSFSWTWLGKVDYLEGLALQRLLRERVIAGRSPGCLLMLEHNPVITLGRQASEDDVLADAAALAQGGVTVHRVERGGDATYHGPGQLVGYPVLPVRGGVRRFVESLAEAARRLLADLGIDARWDDHRPGLWTPQGKIAAVGLHVARRVAIHGIALNVSPHLPHYELLVACGQSQAAVTSIAELLPSPPPLEAMAEAFAQHFDPGGQDASARCITPEELAEQLSGP